MIIWDALKVMTFNIRYGLAEDGPYRWEARKARVVEAIRTAMPDVVGLQECRDDEQAAYVREALPEYEFYGVPRGGDDATALEMAPLLLRRETLDVVERGHFWLSNTPDVPGSKSWDSFFARTVTWAKVRERRQGRVLLCANTHFDYQPSAVVGAAKVLQHWITAQAKTLPVILCGDFNTEKDSAIYRLLTLDADLRDAYRLAHPIPTSEEGTFHGYGKVTPPRAIDWVLISAHFRVLQAEILRSGSAATYLSDHDPVVVTLNWM